MKAKLAFLAGLGIGYVAGTRVGRRGYENLKKSARSFWEMDTVQETVRNLEGSLEDEVKDLGSRLMSKVAGSDHATNGAPAPKKSRGKTPSSRGSGGKEPTAAGEDALPDVESDPALNDDIGRDWTDEGGAMPSGPAS